MPDVVDLLERAAGTPRTSVDPELIVAMSRRRRRRRRVVTISAVAVAMVAMSVAGVRAFGPDHRADVATQDEPRAGIGVWRRAADVPFETLFASAAGLSDGRLLVVGRPMNGANWEAGIYDPSIDSWSLVPPAPLPAVLPADGSLLWDSAVAGDKLAVVVSGLGGQLHAVVYDVASEMWTEVPPVPGEIVGGPVNVAWSGETLVLLRWSPDADAVRLEEDRAVVDLSTADALTLRWNLGDASWTEGAPPPFVEHCCTSVARSSSRVAVWRGPNAQGAFDDGVIYDIASDSWTRIVPGPVGHRTVPRVFFDDGDLVVAGGRSVLTNDPDQVQVARYDPESESWLKIPPSGGDGYAIWWSFPPLDVDERAVLTSPDWQTFVQDPSSVSHYLDPSLGWIGAPARRVIPWDDYAIAVNDPVVDDPPLEPFSAHVLQPDGSWAPAVEAPFAARREPIVVVDAGDRMYVIGGRSAASMDGLEAEREVWILDLRDRSTTSTDESTAAEGSTDVDLMIFLEPDASGSEREAVELAVDSSRLVQTYTYTDQQAEYEFFRAFFTDQPELLETVRPADLPTRFIIDFADGYDADLAERVSDLPGVQTVVEPELNPKLPLLPSPIHPQVSPSCRAEARGHRELDFVCAPCRCEGQGRAGEPA